jgi:putative flippase GtrA
VSETDEAPASAPVPGPPAALPRMMLRARALEVGRFLSVGAVAFVVDLGLFNLLRFGPGHVLEEKPLTAKVISVAAATFVAWLGNRHWTFAEHATPQRGRELLVFGLINVLCAGIPLLTLAFSHYTLDLVSPLADNISTVIGIGIGTVLRYLGYKRWVFTGHRP